MGSKKPPKLRLKPVNLSTGFAQANYDPRTGKGGYTLNPELAKFRDMFYGAANEAMPDEEYLQFAEGVGQQGQQLFGRGSELLNQATATDTGDLAQNYYDEVQRLQAPSRRQEEAALADTLFRTGRSGAAVGYGGGYVNPQQFALLQAREEANNKLALDSQLYGRSLRDNDIRTAMGLTTSGLGLTESGSQLGMMPYQNASSLFGVGTGIEGLGANALSQVGQFSQLQLGADQAMQANKAARKGSGLFSSGLFNTALQIGAAYLTGGASIAATGAMSAAGGGGISLGTSGGGGAGSGLWSDVGGGYA